MTLNLKLINRLIGLNAITFSEGEYKIWNVGMMFFPYSVTAFIQHSFEKKFGKKASEILYYVGKLQAYNGTMLIIRQFGIKNPENMYDLFSEQAAMVGVGVMKLNLVDVKNMHFIIELDNNPYANEYLKKYRKESGFSDNYLRGLVAGASEAAFGGDLLAIETKCISKGDGKCVFEIKEKTKWDIKDPLVKEQMPSEAVDYKAMLKKLQLNTLVKSKISYGDIASNFFKTKKVRFGDDGKFCLLNVGGMSMPMDTCIMFINSFKQLFGRNADKILYEAGNLYSKTIIEATAKEKITTVSQLNSILSEWQTFGFGMLQVVRCNEQDETCHTKLSEHIFAKHYVKIFGMQKEPIDPFMPGIVNGVLEFFHNRKLLTIEKQCLMQGRSSSCYFETTPQK